MPAWRYRCPEGHAGVELGKDRFWCRTCEHATGTGAYDISELVDLAAGGAA